MNLVDPSLRYKSQELLVAMSLCFLLILATRFEGLHLGFFWDEAGFYGKFTRQIFEKGLLSKNDALPPFLVHPPFYYGLIASIAHLFGWKMTAIRMTPVLMTTLLLTSVYGIGRAFGSKLQAAALVLASFCLPVMLSESVLIHPDLPKAAFAFGSIYLLSRGAIFLSGILFGFSLMANTTLLFTLPGFLYLLWHATQEDTSSRRHSFISGCMRFFLPSAVFSLVWFAIFRFKTGHWHGLPSHDVENYIYQSGWLFVAKRFAHRTFQVLAADGRWVLTVSAAAMIGIQKSQKRLKGLNPLWSALLLCVASETIGLSLFGATHQRYAMISYVAYLLVCMGILGSNGGRSYWMQAGAWAFYTVAAITSWMGPPTRYSGLEYRRAYQDEVTLIAEEGRRIAQLPADSQVIVGWPVVDSLQTPESEVDLKGRSLHDLRKLKMSPMPTSTSLFGVLLREKKLTEDSAEKFAEFSRLGLAVQSCDKMEKGYSILWHCKLSNKDLVHD